MNNQYDNNQNNANNNLYYYNPSGNEPERKSHKGLIAGLVAGGVALVGIIAVLVLFLTGVIGKRESAAAGTTTASARTSTSSEFLSRDRTGSASSQRGASAEKEEPEEIVAVEAKVPEEVGYYIMTEMSDGTNITTAADAQSMNVINEMVLFEDGTGYFATRRGDEVRTADIVWDDGALIMKWGDGERYRFTYTFDGKTMHITDEGEEGYLIFEKQDSSTPERPEDNEDESLTGEKVYFLNTMLLTFTDLYVRPAGDKDWGEKWNGTFVMDYMAYVYQDTARILTAGDPGTYDIKLVQDDGTEYVFENVVLSGECAVLIGERPADKIDIYLLVQAGEDYELYLPE